MINTIEHAGIEKSLPPSDRTPEPEPDELPAPPPVAPVQPFNADLRNQLDDFLKVHAISQTQFARTLGRAVSSVNRYLSGTPIGDVKSLELAIIDGIDRFKKLAKSIIIDGRVENGIARTISRFFDRMIVLRTTGVVYGPAGIGKTVGIELYARQHPSSITITAKEWSRGGHAVLKLLWNQIDTRGWKKSGLSRGDYLEEKFKGSDRLIIIDNAQRLSPHGFNFLFDLHDATKMPMVFVGNPEISRNLESNDQHFSRLDEACPLALSDVKAESREVLQVMWPERVEELSEMAATICAHPGRFRALEHRLTAAKFDTERNPDIAVPDAIRRSHKLFVSSDYSL
jgi:DNA transposition AAA+ family ATPase